jgi:hypothetical protein
MNMTANTTPKAKASHVFTISLLLKPFAFRILGADQVLILIVIQYAESILSTPHEVLFLLGDWDVSDIPTVWIDNLYHVREELHMVSANSARLTLCFVIEHLVT